MVYGFSQMIDNYQSCVSRGLGGLGILDGYSPPSFCPPFPRRGIIIGQSFQSTANVILHSLPRAWLISVHAWHGTVDREVAEVMVCEERRGRKGEGGV